MDRLRNELLHSLRGNVVRDLKKLSRVSHVHVERDYVLSHIAKYRRKVLHIVRRRLDNSRDKHNRHQ